MLDLTEQDKLKFLIVDPHELVLKGTVSSLQENYPNAEIKTAQTSEEASLKIKSFKPNLIIVELSIPKKTGCKDQIYVGLELLKKLMESSLNLHIVVLSSYPQALVKIKHLIDNYFGGGFTIVDKCCSIKNFLHKVNLTLQGITYTKDIPQLREYNELKPEWLEMLNLAFDEGLEDNTIAQKMNKSLRTIRNYWTKIQDFLKVYSEDGKNLRIQTEIAARKAGWID